MIKVETILTYWEVFEAETDIKKLEEVIEFFNKVEEQVKESFNIRVYVAPHTLIRLAQGPMSLAKIKKLTINALQHMIQGSFYNHEFSVKTVRFDREEVFNHDTFCVCKEWLAEKGQVDLISMGIRGRRPHIIAKAAKFGLTREQFEELTNEEKKELFKKFYS